MSPLCVLKSGHRRLRVNLSTNDKKSFGTRWGYPQTCSTLHTAHWKDCGWNSDSRLKPYFRSRSGFLFQVRGAPEMSRKIVVRVL